MGESKRRRLDPGERGVEARGVPRREADQRDGRLRRSSSANG
jgi:hypothetical protein